MFATKNTEVTVRKVFVEVWERDAPYLVPVSLTPVKAWNGDRITVQAVLDVEREGV